MADTGRVLTDRALVSDQAPPGLAPSGFDPSRSFVVRPWTVIVSGYGHGDYIARTRGKALADAWRSSAFEGWTFAEFLKRSTCRLNRHPWERFGEAITVAGKPAFLVSSNKQYVVFVRPDSDVLMSAHPFDVIDGNGADWPYWAKRPPRNSDGSPEGGDGEAGSVPSTTARAEGVAQPNPGDPS